MSDVLATRSHRRPSVTHKKDVAARPDLRVVRRPKMRARRAGFTISIAMVILSLVVVVVGHSLLAQGQIKLSLEETALAHAKTVHRHLLITVATLEDPSRIVTEATKLGMSVPSVVHQIPYVNLSTQASSNGGAASTPGIAQVAGSTSSASSNGLTPTTLGVGTTSPQG